MGVQQIHLPPVGVGVVVVAQCTVIVHCSVHSQLGSLFRLHRVHLCRLQVGQVGVGSGRALCRGGRSYHITQGEGEGGGWVGVEMEGERKRQGGGV